MGVGMVCEGVESWLVGFSCVSVVDCFYFVVSIQNKITDS